MPTPTGDDGISESGCNRRQISVSPRPCQGLRRDRPGNGDRVRSAIERFPESPFGKFTWFCGALAA